MDDPYPLISYLCDIPQTLEMRMRALQELVPFILEQAAFQFWIEFLNLWQSQVLGRSIDAYANVFRILMSGYKTFIKILTEEETLPVKSMSLGTLDAQNMMLANQIWKEIRANAGFASSGSSKKRKSQQLQRAIEDLEEQERRYGSARSHF
jgi:hypothetical protein